MEKLTERDLQYMGGFMEKLTERDLQYITGQLTFAKEDGRLYFTPYGEEVLKKLCSIVASNLEDEKKIRWAVYLRKRMWTWIKSTTTDIRNWWAI